MSRPRLLRTDTIRPLSARIFANVLMRSSDGRSNGMPGAALSGSRLTFAFTPASTFTSLRASSSRVVDAGQHHVLEHDAAALRQREALARVDHVLHRVLLARRHDGARAFPRWPRAATPRGWASALPARACPSCGTRPTVDSVTRFGCMSKPFLLVQHPQRLHRVVVVLQRLAHAHQDDVEGLVEQVERPREQADLAGDLRRRSGGESVPSCRSGRTRSPSRSRPASRRRTSASACRE